MQITVITFFHQSLPTAHARPQFKLATQDLRPQPQQPRPRWRRRRRQKQIQQLPQQQ